jgi:ATP-dependent 26S proteasome regulatory subunit
MSKRQNTSNTQNTRSKRIRNEEIVTVKKIIVRNDDDPFIFTNICCMCVKLGNFVYRVKEFNDAWQKDSENRVDNLISLTLSQYNDVKDYIFNNKITVSNFNFEEVPTIERLIISLTTKSTFKIITKKERIVEHILYMLTDHIVSYNQNIAMFYKGILMNISINDIDSMTIGKVYDKTVIDFENFDSSIIICNKCIDLDIKSVKIYIIKCVDLNCSPIDTNNESGDYHVSKFPLIMDHKTLNKYIKATFDDTFADNDCMIYSINGFEFTFNIKVVGSNKQTKFKNIYKLKKDDGSFFIQSDTNNVIITDGKTIATKIYFNIKNLHTYKYDVEDYIVPFNNLVYFIKKNIKIFTTKQTFKYPIRNKEVLLEIKYVEPNLGNNIMYEIDPVITKITFDKQTKNKFILVKNMEPHEIEKIIFKIKKPSDEKLFSFLLNDKSQIFDSKKLEKIVRNLFPKRTAPGHQMKISYNGHDCIVAVKELIFKDKNVVITKNKNSLCGYITKNTEFKFQISQKNKTYTINNIVQANILDNPIGELEKYVGGISNELKKVVRNICLARGKLKNEFSTRGLKPTRGIIFHGPPGTGKTTLARNLGKILGCEGERFKLMSGPEIFNKYVGVSEANVRAIFKPAKEAWKKYAEESPVYMVVIDEIDAMIPARSGSGGNPVRDSVVNQFLAEMDGLEQFNNLICIGITNRLELLDLAAIRAGRFGVHIKIDIPDKKSRVKIFEIHTKKLKELDKLANVNLEKISELTDKFSGADIESVVEIASSISLERLNALDNIDETQIEKLGKITHDDFISAIKEVKETNNKNNTILPHMYN